MGFVTKICHPAGMCPITWNPNTGALVINAFDKDGDPGTISFQIDDVTIFSLVDSSVTSDLGSGSEADFAFVTGTDGEVQIGSNDNNRTSHKRPRWVFVKDAIQVGSSATTYLYNTAIGGPTNGSLLVGNGSVPLVMGHPQGIPTEPCMFGFSDASFWLWGIRATEGYTGATNWTNKANRDLGVFFSNATVLAPQNTVPTIVFQANGDLMLVNASADIVVNNNNSNDIGTSSKRFKSIYAATSVDLATGATITSPNSTILFNASGCNISGNIGFYGTTAVAKPSAYTQTYSTADKTLGAYTADNESSAYTGINNLEAGTVYATAADLNALRVAYENLRALVEDNAQLSNAVVDDLQALGLVG